MNLLMNFYQKSNQFENYYASKNELFPQQPQHITNVMKIKKMYCCDFLLLMNEIFFVVNYYTLQNTQLHTRKKNTYTYDTI